MISRSSSSASLSSSYFLDGPIDRSAMSEDDEHHRTRSAMSDEKYPPRRSQKRKVITSAFSLSLEKKKKDKEMKMEKEKEEKEKKEKEKKENDSKDDGCCCPEYKPKYPYYENALEIPDGQILDWIMAEPDERPTEEQMKNGFFDTARQYLKELRENGGFHITAFPDFDGIGNVIPAKDYYRCEEKMHENMKPLARLSLEKNNLSTQFVVTGFGQVNMIPSYLDVYFINFLAQDVTTGVIGTFKACVEETENDDEKYVVTHFSQKSPEI